MSCHSNTGNRVALSIAKHLASSANLDSPQSEAGEIQRSFHSLTREGRTFEIPNPSLNEVLDWAVAQEEKIVNIVPIKHAQQKTALKNLEATISDITRENKIPDGSTFHAWKHTAALAHYRAQQIQNPSPKVIAIDLDGCLYDFNSIMRQWLTSQGYDRSKMVDPEVEAYKSIWGFDEPTWNKKLSKAVAAGFLFRSGTALEDGVSGATRIGLAGHKLLINSARIFGEVGPIARRSTVQWLRENNIHADDFNIVMGDPKEKLRAEFSLLIDDNINTVKTAILAGRKAILLDRPWNRNTDLPRATYPEIVSRLDELIG